jgi:hypothetical protein
MGARRGLDGPRAPQARAPTPLCTSHARRISRGAELTGGTPAAPQRGQALTPRSGASAGSGQNVPSRRTACLCRRTECPHWLFPWRMYFREACASQGPVHPVALAASVGSAVGGEPPAPPARPLPPVSVSASEFPDRWSATGALWGAAAPRLWLVDARPRVDDSRTGRRRMN